MGKIEKWIPPEEEERRLLETRLLSERLPDINMISIKMLKHVKRELYERDRINKKGANVPIDLIHWITHRDEMTAVFYRGVWTAVEEFTKDWNIQEIRALINFIKKPYISLSIAEGIYDKFSKELLPFDYGSNLPKNFWGAIIASALQVFINALEEKIDSLNFQESMSQAPGTTERIASMVRGLLQFKV